MSSSSVWERPVAILQAGSGLAKTISDNVVCFVGRRTRQLTKIRVISIAWGFGEHKLDLEMLMS
jgi:hypothetical protein